MISDGFVCLSFIFTCQTWLIIVLSLFIISLFVMNLYRRRIVRQLLDSYRQLASVMEHSSDAFFRFNMEGNFTWCSRSAAGILGVDQPEDLLGKSVLGYFMNPEDFHLTMRTILEKETLVDYEVKLHRKDGKVIIMAASANLVYENGQPVGVEGVARDITSRKEAEQAVRRSEERYRTLVESAGEAIFSVDGEGQLLFINSVAARRLGRQSQEIVGKYLADVFPQYLAEKYLKSIRGVINSGVSVTIDSVSELQGIKYLYKTSLSPIREPDGRIHSVLGIARDVTSSIQTSQALEGERNFIRLLLDTANSLIICLDKEVRLTVFNSECERVTGYRRDEVLGKKWSDIFLPREYLHEGLDDFEAWVKKYPSDRYEKDILTKSGERRTILWSNSAMHDPITGELTAIAIGHDITERKIGETALWESEEKYRRLVESSVDGTAIVRDETIVFVNQKMLELHGCTHKKEMEGRAFTDFVAPEFRELMKARGKARQSGQNVAERYIYKGLRRDGSVFDVDISVGCIVYGGQIASQGILRDITEKLRIENALRETRTRFQEALENSLDILYRFNIKTGTYDYISQSAERILGFTPAEIIKMGVEGMRRLAHPDDLKVMGGHRQNLINTSPGEDNSCTVEYRLLCRDGQYRWLSDSHTLVRDSNGVPKFIMGTTRDITENKIAEMALRESEQFNKAVIENSPLGVSVRDKTGRLLSVNEAWTRIWGMSPEAVDEDMRRERPQLCFDKRDTYLGAWKDEVARIYREGGYLHIPEIRSELHRSGRPRWLSQHFYAIRDASGNVDRVVILTEDITGRKEFELALTDSESRFRAIAEATPIPIAITSIKDGRLLYANKLFAPAVGYDAEEIMQVPFQQYYYNPEERQRLTDTIKEQDSIHNFESMGRKKDGSFYWALVTLTRIVYKGEDAIFGGFVDITERKKMEDALRESENRYALATAAARVGIWDWDLIRNIFYLDAGIGLILGADFTHKKPDFDRCMTWVNDEDKEKVISSVREYIDGSVSEFLMEFRIMRAPHHESRWVALRGRIIRDTEGKATRMLGTASDINDRKIAELALVESEERFRNMADLLPQVVFEIDLDGNLLFVNQQAYDTFGYPHHEDFRKMNVRMFFVPDDVSRALKSAREIQEGKVSTGNEYTGLRRDGSTFPLMIYTSLIMKDNKPYGFRGIILDITSVKEAEARVRAADQERFEQAKRTAGVFAHEIRNALFPAAVALEQVKKMVNGNEADNSHFGRYNAMAEKAIGRAAEITRLITSYTRLDSEVMPEKVNLSEIIGEVVGQNEWQITEQKVIVKIGGKTGTWVVSNRRQLILALNNLLINALDALRERENPTLNIQWQTQNGNLLVKFQDNGSGVPEEIRGKIFEPFFTTRIERGGTGIGLPMAKRIIEMYGGDIRLNSRPGQGTTFEIRMIPAEASRMKLRHEGEIRE